MAYQKKTWLARLGQGLNKFIFNGGSKVTLDSSPDVVSQEGTALSADNMNDLEQRIDDEFTNVNSAITSLIAMQPVESSPITITGGGTGSWTIDVSKTGYTAIGIMGFWISSGDINIIEWYINSNQQASVYARNSGSSALSNAKVRPYILYVKNFS